MTVETLPDLNHEYLPPELVLNPHHPATDPYLADIERLKKYIVAACNALSPRHVNIVKAKHQGRSNADIAERLDISPATVSKVLKQSKSLRLLALLRHYELGIEGPLAIQRRHMLWRIACRHEETDPRLTLSAIGQLNKMAYQEEVLEKGLHEQPKEIVINHVLTRGPLDG